MYVCATCTSLASTLYHCHSSDLRRAVPHLWYSKNEQNRVVGHNLLLSWILHNRVHLCQLGMKYVTSAMADFDLKVIRAASTLAGMAPGECWWHSESQGFQPPLWPHGLGISRREVNRYSPGLPVVPTDHLAPGEQRNEAVSRGELETSSAVSPLSRKRPLTQGKLAGRHIPGTSASLYC